MINLTRKQARQIDELAINELGIPGIVLMENAGRNATDLIQRYMQEQGKPLNAALIVCGGGNNGGDGYVVARHLHNRGVAVRILAAKPIDQLTGDANTNATICQNMQLNIEPVADISPRRGELQHAGTTPDPISRLSNFLLSDFPSPPDLIIDALLGTGFQGDLRPDMLNLIQAINATREQPNPPTIAALDLPSGLDCDTGRSPETPHPARQGVLQHAVTDPPNTQPAHAVIADLTLTFAAPKLGFSQPTAWPYIGKFEIADIGTPPQLLAQVTS